MEPHGRFARNTKTRDLGKSPSAIGSAESSPGSKLRFTRRRLHVPTLRVMPKSRDTKIAQKVTKELLAGNGPLALRQQTQAVPRSLGAKSISCPFVRLSCPAALRETPQGWRLRERQRPSLLESSDARADSNRPPGRFRGCCVFVVRAKRREAPHPLHRAPPSAAGADARPRKSLPRHRAVRDLRPATAAGFQA